MLLEDRNCVLFTNVFPAPQHCLDVLGLYVMAPRGPCLPAFHLFAPPIKRWCLFFTPGIWANYMTCSDQQNVVEMTLCKIWGLVLKRPYGFCLLPLGNPAMPWPGSPTRQTHRQKEPGGGESMRPARPWAPDHLCRGPRCECEMVLYSAGTAGPQTRAVPLQVCQNYGMVMK